VAFSIHEVLICLVSEEWVDCLIRLAKLGYTPQRRNCVLSLCSHELFWVYFYALFHMKIMTICTLYIPEEKFSGHRTLVVGILSPSYKAVCQWLATGRRFSPSTPVSSINKTDCHGDIRYNWNIVESGVKHHTPNHRCDDAEWLKCVVKQRLLDQFVQNWQTSLSDSSKASNYRIFKTKFEFEEYFNIF
jgi:hypothetical protein